ncbi:MAG: type II secretion system F family protein [Microlunatus sp.]|nr:type II secretion system F family protein [Microlunatus sp.]MDN5771264.1 type II secretion system F family protein [Microlunatus sp.]MDN5803893.1 type II secretion system F family protein [Microlunatus sp.]
MTAGFAAVAGLLVVAGLVVGIGGLRRQWPPARQRPSATGSSWARWTRRPPGARGRRRDLILSASVLVGFAAAAVSGWVVAIVAAPLLALGLPYLLRLPQARDVHLLEGLDRWVRSLAATLATGRSVTDAIRMSRRTAPAVISAELAMLVTRLDSRWDTREALQRFADDLDSADADPVVAALMLAADRGAVGASATLGELAESIQDQLKGRRLIETERSKPYVVVRQVTIITMITLVGVFVLSPGFFSAYRSPVGQVVLSVLIVAYIGSLVLMRRRAKQPPRERILVAKGAHR